MPVIINELEVVPQAPPSGEPTTAGPKPAGAPFPRRAGRDIERFIEHHNERLRRVWAH